MGLRIERHGAFRACVNRIGRTPAIVETAALVQVGENDYPVETGTRLITPNLGVLVTWKHRKGSQDSKGFVTVAGRLDKRPHSNYEAPLAAGYSDRSAWFGSARDARHAGAAPAASATMSIVPATPTRIHGSVAD